ncbi:hypothetical protein HMPREF9134_00210 [Porphyromonas catoniae F0037]|uniref:Uncharacterized protein n=1 Tax=Porphyromonas catoniae F0037 TaxID=1127696 RepID=L1NHN8_9PORP|nr:hypothetical protein HMPREF9134_00210 [Porphyromonas catoniae F0037]
MCEGHLGRSLRYKRAPPQRGETLRGGAYLLGEEIANRSD